MSKETSKIPEKKPNAAQRLSALERGLQNLSENVSKALNELGTNTSDKLNILADEIDKVGNGLKAVSKRINAVAEVTDTKDEVGKLMIDSAVKELESKVEEFVGLGVLERDDVQPITDKTFVVGREVDADGNVVNPRVQFATASINKNLQDKLLGSKVGDLVSFEEGQPQFEVLEMYSIKEIKKDVEFQDEESPDASGAKIVKKQEETEQVKSE